MVERLKAETSAVKSTFTSEMYRSTLDKILQVPQTVVTRVVNVLQHSL